MGAALLTFAEGRRTPPGEAVRNDDIVTYEGPKFADFLSPEDYIVDFAQRS